MKLALTHTNSRNFRALTLVLGVVAAIGVVAALIYQAIAFGGNPDPAIPHLSRFAMVMSSGILVFREGLEAILVLAAVTAGVSRTNRQYWRSIVVGVLAALGCTVLTWVIAVQLLASVSVGELQLQAATGLLAIVVLLVVMNWFFHKLYWTGWIKNHANRKQKLVSDPGRVVFGVTVGLALLGFTAIYREGFEVVLFLQNLRLQAGTSTVLTGASMGLALTAAVGAFTFISHTKLPYKKMLILTGGLLAGVLVVMVGESVQEMQQAGWLTTHNLHLPIPNWMGLWFALFPTAEGLLGQILALVLVVGSYAWVRAGVGNSTPAKG